MPTFNPNSYFSNRLDAATLDKVTKIQEASNAKIALLDAQKQAFKAQQAADKQAYENSWIGKLGLDPTGFVANRVNDTASLVSGASRLVGQLGSLPSNISAAMDLSGINQEDTDAYNRFIAGKATPQDLSLLQSPKTTGKSVLQSIEDAQKSSATAGTIAKAFDVQSIVDPTNRNALARDLGQDFEASWNKVTEGWDEGKKGNFLDAASGVASGLGGLFANAGAAIVSNPSGVREYIIENAPQLLVGTAGKAGQLALGASNVGYAFDYYRQGLENYAKANNGQLPSEAERARMGTLAATLALAEQAGDVATLGLGKAVKGASKNAVANIGKATIGGVATEAPTEGYQTWAEGEITGKPASAEDIYIGAAIGGASGAGLAGGLRTVAEVTGTTPEKIKERSDKAAQQKLFVDAVASGDVSAYLDSAKPEYSPSMAIQALTTAVSGDDVSPEAKQANLEKAATIVSDLIAQRDNLKEAQASNSAEGLTEAIVQAEGDLKAVTALDPTDTETIAAATAVVDGLKAKLASPELIQANEARAASIAQLDEQITAAEGALASANAQLQSKELDVEVEASKITGQDTVADQKSADAIINLSMAIPERLDYKTADRLAKDSTNGLTEQQRSYLTRFSEAQQAANALKTPTGVARDVYYGGEGFIGGVQHRSNITTALAVGNTKGAAYHLGLLTNFAKGHANKAAQLIRAYDAFKKDGKVRTVRADGNGAWRIELGETLNAKERDAEAAVFVTAKSGKLVDQVRQEAQALNRLQKAMQAAYDLKTTQPKETTNGTQATETQQAEAQGQETPESSGATDTGSQTSQVETQSTEEATTATISESDRRSVEESVDSTTTVVESQQPSTLQQSSGVLAATQQVVGNEAAHADKKLGDFVTQSAGKDTDGSTRPLVAVKNFMEAWAAGTVRLSDYLKNKAAPTDAQRLALMTFKRKAAEWSATITRNLKPTHNEKYNYEDPMRYLIQSQVVNGQTVDDVEQNVKTAIAAAVFALTADQGSKAEINDDKSINGILGRSKDSPVSTAAREALELKGTYQPQLVDALGSYIIDALGFKALKDAPKDVLAKLRVSLGGHALKLMEDVGIVQRSSLTNGQMNALRSENLFEDSESGNTENEQTFSSDNAREGHIFFKLVRNEQGEVIGAAKEIVFALKGSQNIVQNLFGIQSGTTFPSLTPTKGVQQESDTGMGLPGFIKKIFRLNQSRPWKVNKDPLTVLSVFTEEEGFELAGVTTDTTHTHRRNLNSSKAKNDGLKREFTNFMEFVGLLATTDKKMDQEFYLTQEMWKQQRSGYTTNGVNPNASKIVRWLIAADSWTTKIALTDAAMVQSFMLRVSEGFGIKPEKADSAEAIKKLNDVLAQPLMQKALAAVQATLAEGNNDISAEQKQAIKNGVKAGGQNLHTLAALIAYARYQQAVESKAESFTTNLMGEVDGVTNGSILNSIIYGAAATAEQLNTLLEKGGIYALGSKFRQYNLWRGTPGHQDIYESNAQDLHEYVKGLPAESQGVAAAIWAIAGSPINAAMEATKDGRDLLKGPINPLNYGGGFKSIIGKMSYDFVDKVYGKFEKLSRSGADQAEVQKLVNDINTLLAARNAPAMPTNRPVAFYLGFTLSAQQEAALRSAYSETVGEAAKEVVGANFAPFLNRSRTVTQTVNLTYGLYEAVYKAARDAFIKELGIPYDKGQLIHDLTAEQETQLAERLKDLQPAMHTVMSLAEGNVSNGILLAKSSRKPNPAYKIAVGFGTKLKGASSSQMTVTGRSVTQDAPGVIAISGTTHALDSFNSHEAQQANHVLNNHDAVGDGIATLGASAEQLNKSTWKNTLNYSPLTEAHNALMRVVQGIVAMDQRGELTPEMKQGIQKALSALSKKVEGSQPETILDIVAYRAFSEALEANQTKLTAMSQWAVVDQYAMDGGSYTVTDADRQEAMDKLNALSLVRSAQDVQALDALFNSLFGSESVRTQPEAAAAQEASLTAAFGELGKSSIDSDSDLVQFFSNNPQASVQDVARVLGAPNRLNAVNRKLLALAIRALAKVDPGLQIRFVTPATNPADLLGVPAGPSRGWYIANKDGKTEIYVLSPEFKNSGLTAETLLHELVHAAIARTIANPSAEAKELVAELEALRVKAEAYVNDNGLTQFAAAVASVQELVSWGMTNKGFQDSVLSQVSVVTKTGSNRFVQGMKKFIDTITALLFKPTQEVNNGMAVLVSNVSGLFASATEQATQDQSTELNLSQESNEEVAAVQSYSTQDTFMALDSGAVGSVFQGHLSNLLSGIVESLHGPYGAFAAAMQKTAAGNPLAAWVKVTETGEAPFASAIESSGFAASAQETFVMQQVEATVSSALERNEVTTKQAYRELVKLYNEAKARFTPQDFVNAGFTQADYDFVFDIAGRNDGRSDYLSRFAAIGLANERFAKLMQFESTVGKAPLGKPKSLFDRLVRVFEQILNFFNMKSTQTYVGQAADEKLSVLVRQLVDIEAQHRHKVAAGKAGYNKYIASFEESTKNLADSVKQKVYDAATSKMVRESSLTFVKTAGALVQIASAGKVDVFLDRLRSARDYMMDERDGLMAGVLRELGGPVKKFQKLLLIVKHGENLRQSMITQTGSMLLKEFANGGKDLTKEQKSALTATLLRTGAHNLLGHFTFAEIANLMKDRNALAQAITDWQAKLTSSLKDLHIEQANGLGYYKATDINGVSWLMKNAHVIARMMGTQYASQITEAQAAAEEQTIAVLATLYGLKYSKQAELILAANVLQKEDARTDANGVEFLLKAHQGLEKEALERLFKNNPTQMIHGYTPEIYDPYVTVKVANGQEGKDLLEQGYTYSHGLTPDSSVPDANGNYGVKQGLYVLKGVGMNRRVSGAFSLTSEQSRGTTIHDGFTNTNTYTGTLNASKQASVTNAKHAEIGTKAPDRDLSTSREVIVAPVYDENGNVVNWSYLMSGQTKDNVLRRENRFEKVMGTLAGSVFDKKTSKEINAQVVKALYEQFDEGKQEPWAYIEVGERVADPEMRELWNLLPEATRAEIKKVWGQNKLSVRKDSLDNIFGYRKLSAADFLAQERAALSGVQKMVRELLHSYAKSRGMGDDEADNYAKRLANKVTKGERAWQELYKEVKDIFVIKNLSTLLGNIYSNASMLWMLGVEDGWHHQWVALRGIMAYENDMRKLAALEAKLNNNYGFGNRKETENEIAKLRDAIARNPVTRLVDAGMMPTIVEDVDMVDDPYSYKSSLGEWFDRKTAKAPAGLKTAAKAVYMTHDTPLYKVLSRTTQYSDFVARYALYQHLTTKADQPLSHEDAIFEALETFVHYDVPMHRTLQYMDDMGFTPFMKYFFRVQRVLVKSLKEHPARVLGMATLNNFLDLGPIVLDSSAVAHLGNMPFRSGAGQFPGALGELLTVQPVMAALK